MLELARGRVGVERVRYRQGDALTVDLPECEYDLIATHFFFDCFEEREAKLMAEKVARAGRPGALWVVSEFRQPWWAGPVLWGLYLFFRVTTGLRTSRLVDHRPLLRAAGFSLEKEESARAGLLASELWRTRSRVPQ